MHGRLLTDSAVAMHAAVVHGLGIGLAPLWQVRPLVDAGAVEIVLEDFETASIPIHVVWAPTRMRFREEQIVHGFPGYPLEERPLVGMDAMWSISIALGVIAALINCPIQEKPVARLAMARPVSAAVGR